MIGLSVSGGFGEAQHGCTQAAPRSFVYLARLSAFWKGGAVLKHDPDKLADFSDKIMRPNGQEESAIDSP